MIYHLIQAHHTIMIKMGSILFDQGWALAITIYPIVLGLLLAIQWLDFSKDKSLRTTSKTLLGLSVAISLLLIFIRFENIFPFIILTFYIPLFFEWLFSLIIKSKIGSLAVALVLSLAGIVIYTAIGVSLGFTPD